jgi:hypothetical protein
VAVVAERSVLGEELLSFLEDRVQSGPQESSARRVLGRRSGRLTPRTDLERSGQEGMGIHSGPIHPLRSLNSHVLRVYDPRNLMKIAQSKIRTARSSEVDLSVEKVEAVEMSDPERV